jgi:hypothetical protein
MHDYTFATSPTLSSASTNAGSYQSLQSLTEFSLTEEDLPSSSSNDINSLSHIPPVQASTKTVIRKHSPKKAFFQNVKTQTITSGLESLLNPSGKPSHLKSMNKKLHNLWDELVSSESPPKKTTPINCKKPKVAISKVNEEAKGLLKKLWTARWCFHKLDYEEIQLYTELRKISELPIHLRMLELQKLREPFFAIVDKHKQGIDEENDFGELQTFYNAQRWWTLRQVEDDHTNGKFRLRQIDGHGMLEIEFCRNLYWTMELITEHLKLYKSYPECYDLKFHSRSGRDYCIFKIIYGIGHHSHGQPKLKAATEEWLQNHRNIFNYELHEIYEGHCTLRLPLSSTLK